MGIFQAYNGRTKAWVKYKLIGDKSKVLDVKQKDPKIPFKGIPKRGKRLKGGKK